MNEKLAARMDSFNPTERQEALKTFEQDNCAFNMHCHSFFSYNGYGYSPTRLVCMAKELRWRAIGLVDMDVLDGVDEFLDAADRLGVRAIAGIETRVFVPEMPDVEINSPGEPGIAYHLGIGFPSSTVPYVAREFANTLRNKARARICRMIECVNTALPEIAVEFDAIATQFTPRGNVTERHLCLAYRRKAEETFGHDELEAFWKERIGFFSDDDVALEGKIRSKMLKKGGPGYIEARPENFPTLEEMNDFTIKCGAIPAVAWLNGLSEGENDPEELLRMHVKHGAGAVEIIPDRNWNVADPEKRKVLTAELDRFVATAVRMKLPVLCGTEMNAPGQKLADDFTVPELYKHIGVFRKGADAFEYKEEME